MAKKGKEPAGLKRWRLSRKRKKRVGKGHIKWGSVKSHRRRVAKPKRRKRRVGKLVNVKHRVKRVARRKTHHKRRRIGAKRRVNKRRKHIGASATGGQFLKAHHAIV